MRVVIALALLMLACREEPRDTMFEVSRVKVPRQAEAPCPGRTDEVVGCPEFRHDDFPPRVALPRVVHRVEPEYPASARERRLGGLVILQIGIRRDGTVGGVCVLKPLPCGLSDAAADAVRQWKFEPRQDDVVTNVTVHFPTAPTAF